MSVVLVRIDDRLVHGQVVEGWLRALRINHVVVASDSVVLDDMQKALYLLGIPQGVDLSCLSVQEAVARWNKDAWRDDKVLVLVSSPQDALRLAQGQVPLRSLNVGGLHFKEGRAALLRAVNVDEQDIAALRGLAAKGVALEARPLPLDEPVNLTPYLERWGREHQLLGDQPQ